MEAKKFSELLKNKTPKEIIYMHTSLKINLTDKQIEQVLKLKNKEK